MSFLPGHFPQMFGGTPNPRMRFVNTYNLAFPASNTQTITVGALELQFPASPTKQIVVIIPSETIGIRTVTVNGVNAPYILTVIEFLQIHVAVYAGSGPFNIVITSSGSSSEDANVDVYEVDEAAPVYKSSRSFFTSTTGTAFPAPLRVPNQGLILAAGMSTTDTITQTWSGGVTEVTDLDAGDMVLSSAANLIPSVGNVSQSVLSTFSGSASGKVLSIAIAPNLPLVQGGWRVQASGIVVGTTLTVSNTFITNFTDLGDFKLVIAVTFAGAQAVSGATFNGNAMTLLGSVVNTTPVDDMTMYVFAIDVTQSAPSGNIVVTFPGSPTGMGVILSLGLMYNVGSVGDVQTGTSAVAAGAALALDINEGGSVLAAHIHDTDTDSISWSGVEACINGDLGSFRMALGHRCYCAAETNRAIQATAAGAAANASIAIAFNP